MMVSMQELKESKSLFSSFIDALAGSGTPLQNSSEVFFYLNPEFEYYFKNESVFYQRLI